jgi:hypothetical protein
MKSKPRKYMAVKLDVEHQRIVAALKKEHRTTFSEIVRRALREFAKKAESAA